ncbi:uncharacterized protein LOC129738517 isoform X2 [Uranotaenia lowii]|uniref:uncharacterized protein LOC129738517 isoform X2 n=1 Tax=Uranotaenia lowii TaxID=190385 RepID=UPI002479DCF0|nr:uncharacterized protein LOC129738517 isoform X2 [Uranotaenia lowii]
MGTPNSPRDLPQSASIGNLSFEGNMEQCRLCLRMLPTAELKDIFYSDADTEKDIHQAVRVKVTPNDISVKICSCCYNLIKLINDFRDVCCKTSLMLLKSVKIPGEAFWSDGQNNESISHCRELVKQCQMAVDDIFQNPSPDASSEEERLNNSMPEPEVVNPLNESDSEHLNSAPTIVKQEQIEGETTFDFLNVLIKEECEASSSEVYENCEVSNADDIDNCEVSNAEDNEKCEASNAEDNEKCEASNSEDHEKRESLPLPERSRRRKRKNDDSTNQVKANQEMTSQEETNQEMTDQEMETKQQKLPKKSTTGDEEFLKVFNKIHVKDCKIVTSSRGGYKLVENGHLYNLLTKTETTWIWDCERRRMSNKSERCRAKAKTMIQGRKPSLQTQGEHNHEPDPVKVELTKFRSALREKSKDISEQPDNIIQLCAAEAPPEIRSTISKYAQKRIVQRQLKKRIPEKT